MTDLIQEILGECIKLQHYNSVVIEQHGSFLIVWKWDIPHMFSIAIYLHRFTVICGSLTCKDQVSF